MTKPSFAVAAVVVTYNRKALLRKCIDSLLNQTHPIQHLIVIDNASTDETFSYLNCLTTDRPISVKILSLPTNTGGAGGFHKGLELGLETTADWFWMMDDDAEPNPEALANLLQVVSSPFDIYGSLAVSGENTSWLMTFLTSPPSKTQLASEVPDKGIVQMLPFLGFMINRQLIGKIGLPDAGFFIAADDVEYCLRAQHLAGSHLVVAGKSRIEHPKAHTYEVKLPFRTLTGLSLSPFKRYYDTRNRLLVAKKYFGIKLYAQTIPGSFVRLAAALLREPEKISQLRAFSAGFVDGLLGRKGCRHTNWGIK